MILKHRKCALCANSKYIFYFIYDKIVQDVIYTYTMGAT